MQDTTTVPTKGQTITIQEQPWWNRSCRRRGCDGTASTRVPSDGRCIYLSRGDSPCDHPYTKADWKRGRRPLLRTIKVLDVMSAPATGTPLVIYRDPDGRASLAWLPTYVAGWRAA